MMKNDREHHVFNTSQLEGALSTAESKDKLYDAIVNAPFAYRVDMAFLFLGIIVLLIVDKKSMTINRVRLSKTELAKQTTDVSTIPFSKIKIPYDTEDNVIARTIRSNRPHIISDWKYLFSPILSEDQARINQASGGIGISCIYPLEVKDGGAMIFSYFQFDGTINDAQEKFMKEYTELVSKELKRFL
jgi:hypothetical protein